MPTFYIYSSPVYSHEHLLECVPQWSHDDQSAEVAMLRLLWQHPARVMDPAEAELFVLPVFPYISLVAGECHGETHEQRMSRAASSLRRERFWQRRKGADHLLVTNTFRVRSFGPWLKALLANATVAWFEQPEARSGVGVIHKLAFWRCTVVVPYLANPFCSEPGAVQSSVPTRSSSLTGGDRPAGSVFFQGSWSAAKYLRAHFAELQSMPASHIIDVPRGCPKAAAEYAGGRETGGGQATRKAGTGCAPLAHRPTPAGHACAPPR